MGVYIGILEQKMETTNLGLRVRGFRGLLNQCWGSFTLFDPLHFLVCGLCSTATVRFAPFGLWDSLNLYKKDPFFFPA